MIACVKLRFGTNVAVVVRLDDAGVKDAGETGEAEEERAEKLFVEARTKFSTTPMDHDL